MSAVGRPNALTWIMLAAIPVNVVAGYLAIFGVSGVPGLAVLGAGISSSFIRILVVVAAYTVLYRTGVFRDLDLRNVPQGLSLPMLAELVRVGLPIGVRILFGEGFIPVLVFFVARFGADATAAHAVGLRLESLIWGVALGFSSAAATLAAWASSDRDWRALRELRSALLLVAAVYVAVLAVILTTGFSFVVQVVFSLREPSAVAILSNLLPLLVGYFAVDMLGTILGGYLVGLQDTLVPTVVVILSYWVVGLGIGIFLAHHTALGFYGLWTGMVVGASLIPLFNFARSAHHIKIFAVVVAPAD
jgi:multidrug resistance protein, MATE family